MTNVAFNDRSQNFYGWVTKGSKWLLSCSSTNHTVSFIFVLSQRRYFGIQVNKGTINATIFKCYLKELISNYTQACSIKFRNVVEMWDIAAIHKTLEISDYCKDTKLPIITINLYSSWLNPVESYIGAAKAKFSKELSMKRYVVSILIK